MYCEQGATSVQSVCMHFMLCFGSNEKIDSSMKSRHRGFIRLVLLPAVLLNIVIYCVAFVILQPQAAFAHAYVIGSDPVDGSTVTTIPRVVRIYFNATVSPMSVVQVSYVQNGAFVPVQTRSSVVAGNARELDTALPVTLASGSYFVRWTAIANDDGHTTFGSIGFNVGRSSTGVAGTPTLGPQSSNDTDGTRTLDVVGILAVAWEWLVIVALTFWVGILVTERLILVRVERIADLLDRARRLALPLQWLCLAALFVGEVVTLVLRGVHVTHGIYVTDATNNGVLDFSTLPALLTQTLYGYLWLVRCILIILALLLLWWMSRRQHDAVTEKTSQRTFSAIRTGPPYLQQADSAATPTGTLKTATESGSQYTTTEPFKRYTVLWFILAGLILCTYAFTENSVGVIQPYISAVVLNGLSLLAQCVWFGGIAYLGYVVLPLLSIVDLDSNTETIVALLRRMTPFVVGGMIAQMICLLFLSETTINAPSLLVDDPYGRVLFVRLILVILLALASLYILFALRPKLARQVILLAVVNADLPARRSRQLALERTTRHLKTVVNLQGLLGAGVLLCTALMSFYAPPIVFPTTNSANPPTSATTTPSDSTQQQKVGAYTVGLQVSPARVTSANKVIVSITDAKGKAVTNAKVQLITNMTTMDMGTTITKATPQGTIYVATLAPGASFSMSGLWNIDVRFQVPGQATQKASFQVTVGV